MPKHLKKRMNASRSQLVKNVVTGETAIYTPDESQPVLPCGWIPLNSSAEPEAIRELRQYFILETPEFIEGDSIVHWMVRGPKSDMDDVFQTAYYQELPGSYHIFLDDYGDCWQVTRDLPGGYRIPAGGGYDLRSINAFDGNLLKWCHHVFENQESIAVKQSERKRIRSEGEVIREDLIRAVEACGYAARLNSKMKFTPFTRSKQIWAIRFEQEFDSNVPDPVTDSAEIMREIEQVLSGLGMELCNDPFNEISGSLYGSSDVEIKETRRLRAENGKFKLVASIYATKIG